MDEKQRDLSSRLSEKKQHYTPLCKQIVSNSTYMLKAMYQYCYAMLMKDRKKRDHVRAMYYRSFVTLK